MKKIVPGLFLLMAFLVAGCSQPFPQRSMYAMDAGHAERAAGAARAPMTLRVLQMRIAKPYDSQLFTYKTGPNQFTQNYYAGFITSPDRLLTGQLVEWLNESNAVTYAVPSGSSLPYDTILESNVTALYGDYSNAKKPEAVIEMRIFLLADDLSGTKVLSQKEFRETEKLIGGDGAAQLVDAWNRAYRRILVRVTDEVRSAQAGASSSQPGS